LEEQFTRGRDTAAEHEQLRVEHSAERCGGLTEPAAQLAQREERAGVFRDDELIDEVPVEFAVLGPRRRERLSDAALIGDLVREAQQCASRAVLLDAAALTASARQPAGDDAHVPDLGTRSESAAEEASARDDRSAHARADREQGHVVAATARPETVLGPAGR